MTCLKVKHQMSSIKPLPLQFILCPDFLDQPSMTILVQKASFVISTPKIPYASIVFFTSYQIEIIEFAQIWNLFFISFTVFSNFINHGSRFHWRIGVRSNSSAFMSCVLSHKKELWKCGYADLQYFTKVSTISFINAKDFNIQRFPNPNYVQLQTAVACGLGLLGGRLPGLHTDAAPKHSLCYFSSVSK